MKIRNKSKNLYVLMNIIMSSLIFLISGCKIFSSIGDFTASNYQNVVCYFNTYYNAKKAYNGGIDALQIQNSPLQANGSPNLYLLDLMIDKPIVNDAKAKFDLVVEKSSRILNNYTKSTLIDNTLMLMGKSYYYNQEFTRAERKFLEIMTQFPESEFIPEAKLWCAKCFLKNRREKDAFSFFDELVKEAEKNENDDILAGVHLVLSGYYMLKFDTTNAISEYKKILTYSSDDALKSQVLFRLGNFFEKFDSLQLASEYYLQSSKFSTSYVLQYWGMNRYGLIQSKLGQLDQAMNIFNSLRGSRKYQEFLDYTYLELANFYHLKDDDATSMGLYNLLDTTYKKNENSVKGYYRIGLIYENKYKEYGKAKESYLRSYEQQINIPEAVLANERYKIVEAYLNIKNSFYLLDSTLLKLNKPDTVDVTVYDTVWTKKNKIDSLIKDSLSILRDSSIIEKNVSNIAETVKTKDSLPIAKPDTIRMNPNKPDTSKIAGLENKKMNDSTAQYLVSKNTLSTKNDQKNDSTSLKNILPAKKAYDSIITRKEKKVNPLDSANIKKTLTNIAKKKYEFGELWLNKFELADSAIFWFENSYQNLPKDSLLANYYFNLAHAYEVNNDKSRSDSLYSIILSKYPSSELVKEVKVILGIPIEIEVDTARTLYAIADSLIERDSIIEAKIVMEKIIKEYPKSKFAEKSQYALGWIYENKTKDIKKAIESYRNLLEKYPKSEYALAIRAQMDTVEKYQPTKKKTEKTADSISSIQKNIKTPDGQKEAEKVQLLPQEKINKPEQSDQQKPSQEFIRKRPVRNIEE